MSPSAEASSRSTSGSLLVNPTEPADAGRVRATLERSWGSTRVAVNDRLRDASMLPALVARVEGERVGLLAYELAPDGLDVGTLGDDRHARG